MKRHNPKHKLSGQERCDLLSSAYGQLSLSITDTLKSAEAPKAYAKYRSFLKSLEGALRHAQCQRDREDEFSA